MTVEPLTKKAPPCADGLMHCEVFVSYKNPSTQCSHDCRDVHCLQLGRHLSHLKSDVR